MDNNERTVDQTITVALLIHWMLFASVFIYGGLAYGISRMLDEAMTDPSLLSTFGVMMSIVSLASIAIVLFVRKFWLSPESLTDVSEDEEPHGQYLSAMIIQGGLLESVAIYGLVLSMMFDWFIIFLPFAITALVLMIIFRPSKRDFERRLERAGWNNDSKDDTKTGH